MKFGSTDKPDQIDFTLPADHQGTAGILSKYGNHKVPDVYVGCAKWNRTDLKNFYPRGTKDELAYYSTVFNSIELNATFYRFFPPEQFSKWKEKTPEGFKFFPKITRDISHVKRLNNVEKLTDDYIYAISNLGNRLGMVFLQMHENFKPKDFDRVVGFVEYWPEDIPLSVEFRHTDWYNDEKVALEVYDLFEKQNISNMLVDTAGRRDLMHMRLTTPTAFVRYVGANHPTDYQRLDDWIVRLKMWREMGINNIFFFIHQNLELESPMLAAHFIKKLNTEFGCELKIPEITALLKKQG